MDSERHTTPSGDSLDKHASMQETLSDVTHHDGDNEDQRRIRDLRSCNCVKENDDAQEEAIHQPVDITGAPGSTVHASIVRPKPLSLSPDIMSQRGRPAQRTPSSPEYSAQRSPLQAHSPASLIFERNVQEDILLPQTSPSIPAHIRTENYIPPVLEASSAAITDDALDPDSVEIVTHNMHQPAVGCAASTEQPPQSPCSDGLNTRNTEELPPTIQNPDPNDIRRLSFISFADVVNAENAETNDHLPSNDNHQKRTTSPNPTSAGYRNMSPSPLHSPVSSHGFGTSPPTSISTSFKGLELSPNRGARGADSPLLAIQRPVSPSVNGELNIETMRQALRRTGSRDLGATRNQVSNTLANED
ncbi:hypothetical protein ASPCAL09867 [Aspergillus calidoustus]|uniref:Uncharacterized protein n=1 Tax=Aspergillus calidoustus TaxID=454130 RepID=A0A0U5G695_ASPCI|nr:hypothetical protein ASPCAL09867 [Aspergillus calidoustus]